MAKIHPSSVIDAGVELADDVTVGPFCVLRGRVKIDAGSLLESHVCVGSEGGVVEIGKNNRFYPGSVVGAAPQDLKYKGEATKLVMGDNNVVRECVTLNIGTVGGGGETRIGSNNLLMAYVHVAHDCIIGNHVVIANTTNFAGHVIVEDYVRIGGVCKFSQFIKLGKFSYIAGDSTANKDILPYSMAQGNYAVARATNKIGLERAGFSRGDIDNIHRAIRTLIKGNHTTEEALKIIKEKCERSENLDHLIDFIESSERGFAR